MSNKKKIMTRIVCNVILVYLVTILLS